MACLGRSGATPATVTSWPDLDGGRGGGGLAVPGRVHAGGHQVTTSRAIAHQTAWKRTGHAECPSGTVAAAGAAQDDIGQSLASTLSS